ncbi:MAG: NINE protein [Saprospiraceae bacterium]|nr:NINE protein [Saprospiraceae bacterium]
MKDKNVAGILALFAGGLGVHRFYLGQTGLGFFYLALFWFPLTWIIGLVDAIVFFSMDQEVFDLKYNKSRSHLRNRRSDYDRYRETEREREREMRRRRRNRERWEERDNRRDLDRRSERMKQYERPKPKPKKKNSQYKLSGIQKYKDYDYDGAIEDFNKALKETPKDVAVHFNLACAYSLTEQADKAFEHIDKAVGYGFDDFERIKTHDALAFLRIQPGFEDFERDNFRLTPQLDVPKEDLLSTPQTNLLDQLKKLGDLREKGLLTEEEFAAQKKRLLEE